MAPALEAFKAARATTAQLLDRMTEADWQRAGTHSESGAYSAEQWLDLYAEHAEIHAAQTSPPAVRSELTTTDWMPGDRPTARTTSAITRPNNKPAMTGVAPLSSYSPRINAPRVAVAAPASAATSWRTGGQR